MSLQPLVENAIVHGLEKKKEGGEVLIRGYKNGNTVIVEVIDNGVGMERDILERFSDLNQEKMGCTASLGMLNVDLRFKRYFGPNYGLTVESEPGCGTRVKLTFPGIVQDVGQEAIQ